MVYWSSSSDILSTLPSGKNDPGIVHQNVDASEGFDGLIDHAFGIHGDGNIALDINRLSSGFFDHLQRLQTVGGGEGVDGDSRPFLPELNRRRASDTDAGPRNQNDFVFKPHNTSFRNFTAENAEGAEKKRKSNDP